VEKYLQGAIVERVQSRENGDPWRRQVSSEMAQPREEVQKLHIEQGEPKMFETQMPAAVLREIGRNSQGVGEVHEYRSNIP